MAWDARSTYYYLVCFATLLMVIIGTVQVVHHAIDLLLPADPYRPSALELYDRTRARPGPEGAEQEAPFTREELERMAEEEAERQRRQQRHNTLRDFIGSLALIVIAAPVYVYHWRQVRSPAPPASGDARA